MSEREKHARIAAALACKGYAIVSTKPYNRLIVKKG